MKKCLYAVIIFSSLVLFTACNMETNNSIPDNAIPSIELTSTVCDTTPALSSATLTSTTTTVSITTTVSSSSSVSSQSSTSVSTLDYNEVELSMLEQAGQPDFTAPIPYVAWTEVNLDKTMYTLTGCSGYEFALPQATKKVLYDAGIAVQVIARTSTDYYRLEGDIYIPCEMLDISIPDDALPAATSCAVYIPAVTTTPAPAETITPWNP